MLTLYVLRHAKSSWAQPLTRDFDRPLNERGRSDAPLMGAFLSGLEKRPSVILCSPAQRTRETLNLVMPELGGENIAIHMAEDLYPGDAPTYLRLIKKHAGTASCLMLIGHNPAIAELAGDLSGGGNEDAFRAMRMKYPTAALSVITFEGDDWAAIANGKGTLVSFTTPAMLKSDTGAPD